jgi:hypothetical protein
MIARPFQQVVVWPGTIVGEANVADFEKFVADEFDLPLLNPRHQPPNRCFLLAQYGIEHKRLLMDLII